MPQAVYILFGALATVAACLAAGKLALRVLRLRLYREEEYVLGFLMGAPLVSLAVFLLCAVGIAYKGVFLATGLGVAAWGLRRSSGESLPPVDQIWKWLFIVVFAGYFLLYFFNAMAPEYSPDGSTYHLGLVARYYREHGFHRLTTNMYANLSQGIEMLYLFAFAFGRHSAAALVHFAFLVSLPLAIICYARRFGFPAAGVCAAVLVFASPIMGVDGTTAYIDAAVAAVAFALFYLLQIWDAERHPRLLIPIGLMAGFCYAVKYTAGAGVIYAVAFVAWKTWRKRQPPLLPVAAVALCAAVMIVPWMAKDWLWIGNPISPFGNRLFPNPYITPGFESEYSGYMRHYEIKSYREIPRAVALQGTLTGVLGPVFLLAPVGLLALGWRAGRQVLLAAAVFGAAYFTNIGARFLIPPLPFLALAMAMAFSRVRWLAAVVLAAHAVVSWPAMVPHYSISWAWRLSDVPWRAALRIVPEEQFLQQRLPRYGIARVIERSTPRGAVVLSFSDIPEAYTSRDIRVVYRSQPNKIAGGIQWTPLIPEYDANWLNRFRFPRQELRRIRLVQTAASGPEYWSIAEVRVYAGNRELPRDAGWRLRAQPNRWYVPLAFDNSTMTRWSSGEPIRPGMFVEVDFGRPLAIDSVLAQCSHDEYKIRMKLEGQDPAGHWREVAAAPETTDAPRTPGLRRMATGELKRMGIGYLVIYDFDFKADDYRTRAEEWGIRQIGESGPARLYQLL